ncbi:hypothetical protein ABIC08_008799 [Bradyrhizobium sp. RT9b]
MMLLRTTRFPRLVFWDETLLMRPNCPGMTRHSSFSGPIDSRWPNPSEPALEPAPATASIWYFGMWIKSRAPCRTSAKYSVFRKSGTKMSAGDHRAERARRRADESYK